MPKAIYTIAKGLYESDDSGSGFEISTGVSHVCATVPAIYIQRIRVYNQTAADGGDSYEALEDTLFTVNGRVYELDVDNDGAATGDVAIATNTVGAATEAHALAALIATGINNDGSNPNVYAVADVATTIADSLGVESTNDYADILVYGHKTGVAFGAYSSIPETHIAFSIVSSSYPTHTRSFSGSFYIEAGRSDELSGLQSDADLDVGALEDGSNVGETVLILNNSAERDVAIEMNGGSSVVDSESGVLLAWSGSAWSEVKSYGTVSIA